MNFVGLGAIDFKTLYPRPESCQIVIILNIDTSRTSLSYDDRKCVL